MVKPLLTIAIVTHNEESNLAELLSKLDGMLKTSLPRPHILFIDNNSNDNTKSIIDHWISQSPHEARSFFRARNNLAEARQQAIDNCHSQFVAFIDADCRPHDDWLNQVQLSIANPNPMIAAIGGSSPYTGEGLIANVSAWVISFFPWGNPHAPSQYVDHIPSCNIVYQVDKVQEVGGFECVLPFVGEDLLLSKRLRHRGFLLAYQPKIRVSHQMSDNLWGWTKRMFRYGMAQPLVFWADHGRMPTQKWLPALFVMNLFLSILIMPKLVLSLITCLFAALVICQHRHWYELSKPLFMFLTTVAYGFGEFLGGILFLKDSLESIFIKSRSASTELITRLRAPFKYTKN